MSGSVNKVILVGNVGRDPEIRHTQDGNAIANFSIATSESWKDKNSGEKNEKTEWHRVVCFNEGLTKVIESYVKKGSKVYIEGQLQTRKWQDKDGSDRYSTEVVLSAFRGVLVLLDGPGKRSSDDTTAAAYASASRGGGTPKNTDPDDEIPF